MSGTYSRDRLADASEQQSFLPDVSASWNSVFLAVLAGLYALYKAAGLLGFPVDFWLSIVLQICMDNPLVRYSLKLPIALGKSLRGQDSYSADSPQSASMRDSGGSGGHMLSSVFGLNSSGLLKKGVNGFTGALSKSYSNVPPGLGNWDNSCYQNSVIQGLASIPSVREYLAKTTSRYGLSENETTTGALFDMMNKLNNPENHGSHFWIRGILKSMSTFQQQDAQEYYSKVLEALDKEVLRASQGEKQSTVSWLLIAKSVVNSPSLGTGEGDLQSIPAGVDATEENSKAKEWLPMPSNPLDGLQAQRVGCVNCGFTEGLSFIPFNCLTVPLGNNRYYDIRDCLDEFTNLEFIEGVECAKCTLLKRRTVLTRMLDNATLPEAMREKITEGVRIVQDALDEEDFDDTTLVKKCQIPKKNWVQSTKSRQAVIGRAPKSLVLHVNRSVFDEYTGAQLKNSASVRFPSVLDLGLWCLGNQPLQSDSPDTATEEWPRDPNKSMLRGSNSGTLPTSPFQYKLRAVVTHYGRHENGHYVCYRQHPFTRAETATTELEGIAEAQADVSEERWWRFSDEDVTAVSEEHVLQQGGVFMLFYERIDVDPGSPLTTDQPATSGYATVSQDAPLPAVPTMNDSETMDLDPTALEIALPDSDSDSPPSSPVAIVLPPSTSSPIHGIIQDGSKDFPKGDAEHVSTIANTAHCLMLNPESSTTTATYYDASTSGADTDTTAYDSEDAPSTQVTSDDEANVSLRPQNPYTGTKSQNLSHSPQLMRAGDTPRRGNGGGKSLPMVTAGY